jgi:isopropylmalate/homocitrate/citramalate synthase
MARWWEKPGRVQWNEGRALEPGKWWVPLGNIITPVRSEFAGMPDKVIVKDDTLREGEEQPNHKPITVDMKVRLAHELEDIGITETEVGFPATLEAHRQLCKALRDDGVKMKQSAHPILKSAKWKESLDKTANAGVDVVYMLFPGSESDILSHQKAGVKLRDNKINGDLCEFVTDAVKHAKSLGLIVRAGISTVAKAPLERVGLVYKAIAEAGADRAHVSDGSGCNIPENMKFYVRFVKAIVGPNIKIASHCHNDYGLANANMIAAVTAGCEIIDLSVNGLGDRAGISALEVVVPALEVLYGVDTGIKLEKLQHISDFVEDMYGIKMQQHYPIVGDSMWVHEMDVHVRDILQAREAGGEAWAAFNIIKPEMFGTKEKLQFSPTSIHKGPDGCLALKIRQMGLSATDKQFDELVARILEISARKNFATEEEVEKIINELAGNIKKQ